MIFFEFEFYRQNQKRVVNNAQMIFHDDKLFLENLIF